MAVPRLASSWRASVSHLSTGHEGNATRVGKRLWIPGLVSEKLFTSLSLPAMAITIVGVLSFGGGSRGPVAKSASSVEQVLDVGRRKETIDKRGTRVGGYKRHTAINSNQPLSSQSPCVIGPRGVASSGVTRAAAPPPHKHIAACRSACALSDSQS